MSMLTPRGQVGRQAGRGRGAPSGLVIRLVVVLVVVAALTAAGFYAWNTSDEAGHRTATDPSPSPSCTTAPPLPAAVAAKKIKVNVYNATDRRGLAARVADGMKARGFRIGKVANDPLNRTVTGVAEVRSSPRGAGAARTVAAQLPSYTSLPDQRPDASVDLVLGAGYKALRTPKNAAAALRATPSPSPGECPRTS